MEFPEPWPGDGKYSQVSLTENNISIIYFKANVKQIFELGKKYPWHKPDKCPACHGKRLWGHGFVLRYFKGFAQGLWIKKYRCPDCGCVHTMRPSEFWKSFQYPISTIISCLKNKISKNKWASYAIRQNQQYWFKGLMFQASKIENLNKYISLDILNKLLFNNIIPASHSIQSAILRI